MGKVIFGAFRKAAPEAEKPAKREGEIDRFPTREAFEEFRRREIAASPIGELIGLRLETHRRAAYARISMLQKLALHEPSRPRTLRELFAAILAA